MVCCLTLVTHTHFHLGTDRGFEQTACGMSVPAEHRSPTMFAATIDGTNCPNCLARLSRKTTSPPAISATPRERVAFLLETCVPNADAHALVEAFGGRVSEHLAAGRLERLHALFPRWEARIVKCLADDAEAFVRFVVTCRDEMGLIGPAGAMLAQHEQAIFRVDQDGILSVEPVQDSFELWVNLGVVGGTPSTASATS